MSNVIICKYVKPIYYNYFKRIPICRWIIKQLRYKILKFIHVVDITKLRNQKEFVCTLPWDHVAIKAHGGVTCSTASRGLDELFFGNINESSFIEIWHGAKFHALRQSIRDPRKKLPYLCYTCPYKIKYTDISHFPLIPSYPKVLWIESTDKCNLKCPVCLHSGDRTGSSLSMKKYTQIIDELGPHLKDMHFYLDGENYMHPDATEMTRYAKMINPKLKIVTSTNGLLLNTPEKQEDFVRSGVDMAIFSIDGATQDSYARYRKGGQLDLVLNNLQGIIAIRNRLKIPIHLRWRYILFEWNDSVEEMDLARELACKIGVDDLIWLITSTVFHSKKFLIPHINEYPTKLPNEQFEAAFMGAKEIQLGQKLV